MSNELCVDISAVLHAAQELLLTPPVSKIDYSDLVELRNNRLPADRAIEAMNLYALWIREGQTASWTCMYIGQRKQRMSWSRVRQHLFHTPVGTQSKFAVLAVKLREGFEVGITVAHVEPDSLRLAVEEDLIYLNTPTATSLPWNTKGRKVPLEDGSAKRSL